MVDLAKLSFIDDNVRLLELRGNALHEITHYGQPNHTLNFTAGSGMYQAAKSKNDELALYGSMDGVFPSLPKELLDSNRYSAPALFLSDGDTVRSVEEINFADSEYEPVGRDLVRVDAGAISFGVGLEGSPYHVSQTGVPIVVSLDKNIATDAKSGKPVSLTVDRNGVRHLSSLAEGNLAISSVTLEQALDSLYSYMPELWDSPTREDSPWLPGHVFVVDAALQVSAEHPMAIPVEALSKYIQTTLPMDWARAGGTQIPGRQGDPVELTVSFQPYGNKPMETAVIEFDTSADMSSAYKMAMVDRRITNYSIGAEDGAPKVKWSGSFEKSIYESELMKTSSLSADNGVQDNKLEMAAPATL